MNRTPSEPLMAAFRATMLSSSDRSWSSARRLKTSCHRPAALSKLLMHDVKEILSGTTHVYPTKKHRQFTFLL